MSLIPRRSPATTLDVASLRDQSSVVLSLEDTRTHDGNGYVGEGRSVDLTPHEARNVAIALLVAARSIDP
jgi:hypothetical protein